MEDQNHEEELDLLEYWNILWRRKYLLIILFAAFVSITMVVSFLSPKYYKSEALILVSESQAGGLGAALSSSPLSAVLGGSGLLQTPADKAMVILKSRTLSEAVIKNLDLMKLLFDTQWDASKGTWKDPEKRPFMQDAVKVLTKNIVNLTKSKDGTVTISVEWKDPRLAADIANYYVTSLADILNEKSINLTIQVVDKAVPSERKSRPKIAQNMELAGVLGLFIGVFIAFFMEYLAKQKKA